MPTQFKEWLASQIASHPEWNQKVVGALAGVTGQAVGNWLSGSSRPDPEALLKLAQATGVEPAYLFHITYDMPLPEKNEELRQSMLDSLDRIIKTLSPEERKATADFIELIRRTRTS